MRPSSSPPFPLFLSSLASHLHYPPPCLFSSSLSNHVCNGARSLKIFPLHSNAPPHYCSLCCRWCRRQCWDVKLHQRRLHIASAHFPVVSRSWKWFSPSPSLLTPAFSLSFFSALWFLTHSLFSFLSCFSACLFVPFHHETNSIHKLSGHMWPWNYVGPFSVILHNKVNKPGCCVGCLWTQREPLMEGEKDKQGVRDRRRRETQPAQIKEVHSLQFITAVALLCVCVWQQVLYMCQYSQSLLIFYVIFQQ